MKKKYGKSCKPAQVIEFNESIGSVRLFDNDKVCGGRYFKYRGFFGETKR